MEGAMRGTISRRRLLGGAGVGVGWATAGTAALAACAPAGSGQGTSGSAPAARREVTLEWLAGANAVEEQIYRKIATAYEAANAPHRVNFIADGNWQVKLETMAAAGTPPDVVWHGPEWFPGVVAKG